MKQSRVTRTEVQAAAREQGHLSMDAVDAVVLETDGSFSVMGGSSGVNATDVPVGVPAP